MAGPISERDKQILHIIAGLLSTIDFTPSEHHPGNMLSMADLVIHHLRLLDSETTSAERQRIPEEGEIGLGGQGPFEGQDARH